MENVILFDKYDQVISGLKLTPDQMILLRYLDNKGFFIDEVEFIFDTAEELFFKEVK